MSRDFRVDLPIIVEKREGDIFLGDITVIATFRSIDVVYPNADGDGGTSIVSSGIDFLCPLEKEEVEAIIYKAEYLGEFVLLS